MPEFREYRQARRREDENWQIGSVFLWKTLHPLPEVVMHAAVVDARAKAQERARVQPVIGALVGRKTFSPQHISYRVGYLGRVLVMDRLEDDKRLRFGWA